MKLKVCGNKYNPLEVAAEGPDLLGFIFWEGSPRNVVADLPEGMPEAPGRVGVFVDAEPEFIRKTSRQYALSHIQLHGNESPEYCCRLRELLAAAPGDLPLHLIKAFAVGPGFDFKALQAYRSCCDYFLFDSRGPLPGGNGTAFDWTLLEAYPYDTPYFLSGGIAPESVSALSSFLEQPVARHCYALDVNSKFETGPGLKDTDRLRNFMASPLFGTGLAKPSNTLNHE